MAKLQTWSFKSGNSVAVRMPQAIGVPAGVTFEVERRGAEVVIRPTEPPGHVARKMRELANALLSSPPTPEVYREPIEFPDRA